jgi:hypothetical protein
MIAAVHALTGAALGGVCRSRTQALLVGGASHLAADALPHRDLEIPEEALLLGSALGVIALKCGWDSREFAGAVGAALPDVENLVARVLDVPNTHMLLPTHRGRHGRETKDFGGQVLLSLGCLAALFLPRCRCAKERERGNSSR